MAKRALGSLLVFSVASVLLGCGGGGGESLYSGAGATSGGTTGGGTTTGGGSSTGGGISQVSTGVPTQRSVSLSAEKYALNWATDGDTTTITARVTDTAGNPVPDGTPVQFSTEGGQIQTSCRLSGVTSGTTTISSCSVNFSTQNLRPLDGLITVLAWLEGQEAFVDLNGNGAYDSGEPFYDTGRLYRDDNVSATYDAGVDELNVGGTVSSAPGLGQSACGANSGTATGTYTANSFGFRSPALASYFLGTIPYSVDSTCDGAWGRSLIRGSLVLPVSDPRALGITAVGLRTVLVFSSFSAVNAVAAPGGTTLTVLGTLPTGCTVDIDPAIVPDVTVAPTIHTLVPTGACGASVNVRASFGGFTASAAVPL